MHIVKKHAALLGFSIMEISAVLVVGSVLIAGYAGFMNDRMRENEIKITRYRLEEADKALKKYWYQNGRFPGPANIEIALEDENFGRNQSSGSCHADTEQVPGYDPARRVCIGGLPVRDLNLPDANALDAWNNRLVYAVSKNMVEGGAASYNSGDGTIEIVDGSNNTVLENNGMAQYAVLSYGQNQKGAYSLSGTRQASPDCGPDSVEMKNCDLTDAIFGLDTYAEYRNDSRGADDMVVYWPKTIFGGSNIYSFTVLPFNRKTCPTGWTPFIVNGTNQQPITGRIVVGTGNLTTSNFNNTFATGDTGGLTRFLIKPENMPPHRHQVNAQFRNFVPGATHSIRLWGNTGTSTGHSTELTANPINPVYTVWPGDIRPIDNNKPYKVYRYCMKE